MDASTDVCDSLDGCDSETEAGALLADLERRQDDVLAQLDALDQQLSSLLRGLGVTLVDDREADEAARIAASSEMGSDDDGEAEDEVDDRSRFVPRCISADASGESTEVAQGFAKLPSEQYAASGDTAGGDAEHSRAERSRAEGSAVRIDQQRRSSQRARSARAA
jgi:hypothetical protein